MNENDELILEDDGNLYWQITTEEESLKMFKMKPRIGEVEEEFVDVVQDVLKELKRLRKGIAKRDALVDSMNTATVAFIDKYYALDDYMLYMYTGD